MSNGNSREVALKLRVDTLGAEGIAKLEQNVRDLAAQGGDAAPIFNKLADEIARLGQNAQALQGFEEIAREVNNLSLAAERGGTNALALAQDLVTLNEATRAAADTEAKLRAEMVAAELATQKARDAIVDKRNETQHAQRDTDAYRDSQRTLKIALTEAERAERDVVTALQQAVSATKQAATTEKDHEKALQAATKAADADARALTDRNSALNDARTALAAAGVSTEDMAQSNARLVTELNLAGVEADSLATSVQRLATREQQLADIRAFEKQANDAKQLVQASDYVRFWQEELQKAEAQVERTATASKQAAQNISNAFSTVGTKDVAGLQGEIVRVREAMNTLKTTAGLTGAELDRAMRVGNSRIKELERDVREATGSLTVMDRVSSALKSTLGQFAAAYGVVDIGTRLAQGFVDANKQMETLRLGLGTIYKDTALASKQIEFLNSVANKAGVSTSSISEAFVKFAASMHSANIPLADSNALFAATTQAAGTLGLSGDKVSHMLDALSQMAGKGTVSLEELRQQLGDSLPGAMGLVAKGLGITEAQLIKLVESGQLAARDLFPALTASLKTMAGEVNTLQGGWERFKNALTISAQAAGDSGWLDALKAALSALGVVVGVVVLALQGLFEVVFGLAKAAATLGGALVTLSNPMEALGGLVDSAATRLSKMIDAFDSMTGYANSSSKATTDAGNAATAAGAQHDAAAGSVVKLQVAYAELEKQQTLAIDVAEKHLKAVEKQGDAMNTLAKLSESEIEVVRAAVVASEQNAVAALKVADAKEALVVTLRHEKEQIEQVAAANKEDIKTREPQLKLIDERLQKAQAAAEVAHNEAEAMRATAAASRLAAAAHEDNSKAVDMLRQGMLLAQTVLQETQRLEINGKRTKDDVTRATIAAAEATGLYRDALHDAAAAAERNIAATNTSNQLLRANLDLALAEAKAAEARALALGNEYGVRQAQIAQKEIEIQLAKLNVQAILAEADATEVAINAKTLDLIASGKLTSAMEAEIDARLANVKMKRLEAQAAQEGIAQMELELRNMKLGIGVRNDHRTASDTVITGIKGEIAARDGNIARMDAETKKMFELNKLKIDEINNRNRVGGDTTKTADGFTKNADGSAAGTFNNTLPLDQAQRLKDTGGTGMSEDDTRTAIDQAQKAYQDMQAFLKLNPGGASTDYIQSVTALMNAANVAKTRLSAGTMTPNADRNSTRTVRLQVGGNTTNVNVASQDDSNALVGVLRSLETASRTSA